MFNYDKFNARLDELGIKKAHIARKINQNPTYIQDHQSANREFTPHETEIIADCLFTTVAYLTDETDVKEKPIPTNEDGLSEKQIELIQLIRSMSPLEVDLLLAQARIEIARRKSQD